MLVELTEINPDTGYLVFSIGSWEFKDYLSIQEARDTIEGLQKARQWNTISLVQFSHDQIVLSDGREVVIIPPPKKQELPKEQGLQIGDVTINKPVPVRPEPNIKPVTNSLIEKITLALAPFITPPTIEDY